jgi:hypothetical protein
MTDLARGGAPLLALLAAGCAAQSAQRVDTVAVVQPPGASATTYARPAAPPTAGGGSHNFFIGTPGGSAVISVAAPAPAAAPAYAAPAPTAIYAPAAPTVQAATTAVGATTRLVSSGREALEPQAFYHVTSSTTVNITSPLSVTEERNTTSRVTVTTDAAANVTFDIHSTNGDVCLLHARLTAAQQLEFLPGDRCSVTDDVHHITLRVTVVDGTGTISRDALALQIHWSVSGQVFFASIGGTATQTSSGRRL